MTTQEIRDTVRTMLHDWDALTSTQRMAAERNQQTSVAVRMLYAAADTADGDGREILFSAIGRLQGRSPVSVEASWRATR